MARGEEVVANGDKEGATAHVVSAQGCFVFVS